MYQNVFNPQRYAQEQMDTYYQDCWEVQKSIAKANALEDIRLKGLAMRQHLRQLESERKRATFEELLITSEGELQLITRNLTIETTPRSVTNMTAPQMVILKRLKDETEEIFLLKCLVNNVPQKLFLDPKKAGRGSYLIKNLVLIGVYFHLPSDRAKEVAIQLLALLIAAGPKELLLADDEGYVEFPNRGLIYIGKENLTWKKAARLCR